MKITIKEDPKRAITMSTVDIPSNTWFTATGFSDYLGGPYVDCTYDLYYKASSEKLIGFHGDGAEVTATYVRFYSNYQQVDVELVVTRRPQ